MGAQTFSNLVVVKGHEGKAYDAAREEANDYSGHQEGYSGDIQTVDDWREARGKVPRYGTKAFWAWEEKRLDNIGKREAEYIEITGAVAKRIKDRKGYKGRKGIRVFYFFGWGAC